MEWIWERKRKNVGFVHWLAEEEFQVDGIEDFPHLLGNKNTA